MSGWSRTVAAVLVVALGAMLPATCPCAPQTSADAGHECCAPSAAFRATDDDCCGGATRISEALTAPAAPDLALASPVSSVVTIPPRALSALAVRPTNQAFSPPSLVLRI